MCEKLAIKTEITRSSEYDPRGRKTDRLLSICKKFRADVYVSGPSAKSYLEESKFTVKEKRGNGSHTTAIPSTINCGEHLNTVLVY